LPAGTFPVHLDDGAGPQGVAIGPHNQNLLGYNAQWAPEYRNHQSAQRGGLEGAPRSRGADEVYIVPRLFGGIVPLDVEIEKRRCSP
jgi:hypothetical protein